MSATGRGPLGELVTFQSRSGLLLDGILYLSRHGAPTVLHVHGSFGNFYQSPFVRYMAQVCLQRDMNFLSFNTACHDGLAEGTYPNGELKYIGGGVAPFETTADDIAGAVTFASQYSSRLLLQGHSLGCDRVVDYLLTKGDRRPCILLAPCDSHRLQEDWLRNEAVEDQVARLASQQSLETLDWVPAKEYGVLAGEGWTYRNPITRRALLSILTGPPFRLFRYHVAPAPTWSLPCPGLVVAGTRDVLLTTHPERVGRYFEGRFSPLRTVVANGSDHMFAGFERQVAMEVCDWISLTGSGA